MIILAFASSFSWHPHVWCRAGVRTPSAPYNRISRALPLNATMDTDSDISTVLASLRLENETNGDIVNILYQFEDYYERKLWHQLTLALEEFFFLTPEATPQLKCKVYDLFVLQFANKLNPIKVVEFALCAYGDHPKQMLEKLLELRQLVEKEIRVAHYKPQGSDEENERNEREMVATIEATDAINYIDLNRARYQLKLGDIDDAEAVLDKLAGRYDIGNGAVAVVDTATRGGKTAVLDPNQRVAAAYYYTKYELHKLKKNYNETYRAGLLYLLSVDGTTLTPDQKVAICYDLGVAALLGDKIYNFGELILHEILSLIKDNQYAWLYDLIVTLNQGNKPQFLHQLQASFPQLPLLKSHEEFLVRKITIMSLMELISQQAATSNKSLLFDAIARFTDIKQDQVELLIIKCFALDLIRGQIDQVNRMLHVTWLQPRVLDLNQVKVLYNHLLNWDSHVELLARDVYANGGAIWAEN